MVKHCDKCSGKAEMFLPHGPHSYCREHFIQNFEKRFKHTIRNHGLIKKREHIAVALSGGKDSTTTLHLLNKIFSKSNKISAVLIDEGIPNYRDKALKIAKENCEKLGIPFTETSFKENFDITMAEIAGEISKNKNLGTTCAFCGVLRRNLLNKVAKEMGADKIATGHNLDDETQSIVMNLFDNDMQRLARLGAIVGSSNVKLIPRIKPLHETPENEVTAYAEFLGIKHFGDKKKGCPFRWQAKRNAFRSVLDEMEEKFPGTKYSILRSFLQIKPKIKEFAGKASELKECEICGAPAAEKICQGCKQLKKLAR